MVIRLLFFCCFVFSSEVVDGVLAVVEKEVLLKSEVMQQTFLLASQKNIDPYSSPLLFEGLYDDVLNQMVDNLILYDLAKKDTNVVVLDEQVEESLGLELDRRVDLAGSVDLLEKMFGEPLSLIRSKLRLEIKKSMQIELYTSGLVRSISPSISDVNSFFVSYKDSLPALERRISFSVLEWPVSFGKNKQDSLFSFLETLKDSVDLGLNSFESLARVFSDDVGSSQNGGRLGYTLRGSLVPEYESVAFSLKKGEVSYPFLSPFGCHIVLLNDRVGEKINSSHILKKIVLDDKDIGFSSDSLLSFLKKQNVYNAVNKFDSLCSHYMVGERVFQGVFRSVPVSGLPEFLMFLSSKEKGFVDPFVFENKLYVIRLFESFEPEKQTLQNNYNNIYKLTKSLLVEKKIKNLINNHSEEIYVQKFY